MPDPPLLVAVDSNVLIDEELGERDVLDALSKTPEVVEWFLRYFPEEFGRRYKARKTHLGDRRREKPQEQLSKGVTLPHEGPSAQKLEAVSLALAKTPAVYRSNRDKRRDVEAALRANPAKSNRAIAVITGTTHPFVARMRREMESVTGKGYDLCDRRNANCTSRTRARAKAPCDH